MNESRTLADQDQWALRDLACRYAIFADAGDGDGFAELFTPTGRLRVFRPGDGSRPSVDVAGWSELRALPPALAARYAENLHLVGSSSYEVSGDRAAGTVYCVAHHLDAGVATSVRVLHVKYYDRYIRASAGWRIQNRIGKVGWTETRYPDD